MTLRASMRLLLAGTAVVASIAFFAAPAAHASCLATISVPNISITSDNAYAVNGQAYVCGGWASWDMDHGSQVIDSWMFPRSSSAYFYPGTDPLGGYHAQPTGGYDSNDNPVTQNSPTFSIKAGSHLYLAVSHQGNWAYVQAGALAFNPSGNYGLGVWQPWVGQRVAFYMTWGGQWHYVALGTTQSTASCAACTQVIALHVGPYRHNYGAQVWQTGTVWGGWTTVNNR